MVLPRNISSLTFTHNSADEIADHVICQFANTLDHIRQAMDAVAARKVLSSMISTCNAAFAAPNAFAAVHSAKSETQKLRYHLEDTRQPLQQPTSWAATGSSAWR